MKHPKGESEQLSDIFRKLNVGLPIEHLSINEIDFLCKFYGEDWKKKILKLLSRNFID